MNLHGKNIFVTGASRGIGKAIVLKLAAAGANIAFTHLGSNQEEVRNLETEIANFGVQVQGFHSDAADFLDTEKSVALAVERFGSLDVLVNNAGITRDNLLLKMSEQDWDAVINVNLKSAFNTVKAVVKPFIQQRSGSIINIASVVGIRGNAGQANYAASKAGIIGFTKSIALELGRRNVRANAIAPGFIATAMTNHLSDAVRETWTQSIPLGRIGLPEDVANCAVFLASDASSYITGQVIQVDGGMLT